MSLLILLTFMVTGIFLGAFEYAYTLEENDIIDSAIVSGAFGGVIPHHYIVCSIGAYITIVVIVILLYKYMEE